MNSNDKKRKPSRDIPRHSRPPAEKLPYANAPIEEISHQFHHQTSLSHPPATNVPPFLDPQHILNSEDMDANETVIPKEDRPSQPDSQREHFERLWAKNFERSEIQYDQAKDHRTSFSAHVSTNYIPVGAPARLVQVNGFSFARENRTGKIYTVFRLEMECEARQKRWTVYRRYQDFKTVYDRLRAEGYSLPPLPRRTILRSFDQAFLTRRQQDLEKWLQEVLRPRSSTGSLTGQVHDSESLRHFLTHHANLPPKLLDSTNIIERSSESSQPPPVPAKAPSSQTTLGGPRLTVDDFELLRVVGKGSFGKVLLVRKTDTGELFAMKVLSKPTVVEKKQVEHTRTERRVLATVSHPFIVRLHYAFQTQHNLYFILDYCPGGDMFFHLSRCGSFPEGMAKFYAAEISLALLHLHDLGVIYRDLKPENIMLDVEGHVKLADFGLAKEGITNVVHGTNTMCGTPEYLPPEILNRDGHGKAVDWWNLGMVLFELLTGRPPWYTTDRMQLFFRLRQAELMFPPGMSPESMSFIRGLLNRNPAERLGSGSRSEILNHPFFAGVNWDDLQSRKITPPFQPCQFADPEEAANFESTFTQIPVQEGQMHAESTTGALAAASSLSGREDVIRNMSYTFQGFTYEGNEKY